MYKRFSRTTTSITIAMVAFTVFAVLVCLVGAQKRNHSFSDGSLRSLASQTVGDYLPRTILALSTDNYDDFGYSIAIASIGTSLVALMGASSAEVNSNSFQGASYSFSSANYGFAWAAERRLTASDGSASNRFGTSVALTTLKGTVVALVGAPNYFLAPFIEAGAAYVYTSGNAGLSWSSGSRLVLSPGERHYQDNFGSSTALATINNTVVAILGAPSKNINQGYAYSSFV